MLWLLFISDWVSFVKTSDHIFYRILSASVSAHLLLLNTHISSTLTQLLLHARYVAIATVRKSVRLEQLITFDI